MRREGGNKGSRVASLIGHVEHVLGGIDPGHRRWRPWKDRDDKILLRVIVRWGKVGGEKRNNSQLGAEQVVRRVVHRCFRGTPRKEHVRQEEAHKYYPLDIMNQLQ